MKENIEINLWHIIILVAILIGAFFVINPKNQRARKDIIVLPAAPTVGDTLQYIFDSTKIQNNEKIKAIIVHITNNNVDTLYRKLQLKHEPRYNQNKSRFDSLQD